VQVVGRDRHKLEAFHRSWVNSLSVPLSVHLWEDLPHLLPQANLLVNTTPVGMHAHSDASPLTLDELKRLQAGAIAYDLIYTPRPTKFLQLAEKQGAIALDGLEMLIQQGAAALQIWLGQPAPVEVMRRSVEEVMNYEF
jgi:shikimate dehydrogenase